MPSSRYCKIQIVNASIECTDYMTILESLMIFEDLFNLFLCAPAPFMLEQLSGQNQQDPENWHFVTCFGSFSSHICLSCKPSLPIPLKLTYCRPFPRETVTFQAYNALMFRICVSFFQPQVFLFLNCRFAFWGSAAVLKSTHFQAGFHCGHGCNGRGG